MKMNTRLVGAIHTTMAIISIAYTTQVAAGGKGGKGEDIILYNNNLLIRDPKGKGGTLFVGHGGHHEHHEEMDSFGGFGYGFGEGGHEHSGHHEFSGHHEHSSHHEHKKEPVVVVEVKGKMKSKGKGGKGGMMGGMMGGKGKGKGKGKGEGDIDYEKLLMGGHHYHHHNM